MTRFSLTTATAAVALFSAHQLHAMPFLNARQSPVQWLGLGDFFSQFGFASPTGRATNPDGTNGWVTASDGSSWVAYTGASTDYAFVQDDANTARCLVNLHFTQDTGCISLAGSECEANAGTSRILNVGAWNQGNDGPADGWKQLTGDDSATIQAGIQAMVGGNVNSSPNSGVTVGHYDFGDKKKTDTLGDVPTEHGAVKINFGGSEQC